MVKTNLTVEDFEDKKFGEGKTAGRYTRFKTDQGWVSSFDKPTIEKLKDSEGKCVCVEILTDKNDKQKISKFYGDAKENSADEVSEADDMENVEVVKIGGSSERKSVKGSAYEKDPVGLAIELIVAGKSTEEAIKAVQEVQKAFA